MTRHPSAPRPPSRRARAIGLLGLGLALLAPDAAEARVKLLTLPVRQKVEVHLEHASATLIEEERIVPLVSGANQIDFSWANTRIDPRTVVFRVLGAEAGPDVKARVLSVSYPPGESALVWSVYAARAGAARVRISYLLGGLSRGYSYRAVASADEKTLVLKRYLRLSNQANEGFGQATLHLQDGRRVDSPIDIAETRQILVDRSPGVKIEKTYTADLGTFGYLDPGEKKLRVPMHYVLDNDEAHRLGKVSLPPGKVRIFQVDKRGTQAFLGEDWGQLTPVGDSMRLFLGTAQDIVVRRHVEKRERKTKRGNLYDFEAVIRYEIENFKSKAITLDLVEQLAALRAELGLPAGRRGQLVVLGAAGGGVDASQSDLQKLVMHQRLPAKQKGEAEKVVVRLHVRFDNEW